MTPTEYQEKAARTDLQDYKPARLAFWDPQTAQLMHAAMGMVTEAAEFMDALKKHAMYGKPLDLTNLKEEIGDQLWYLSLALTTLGTTFEEVMTTNIAKLQKRYPGKFTEEAALTRDLDAERKELEQPRAIKWDATNGLRCVVDGCSYRALPANMLCPIHYAQRDIAGECVHGFLNCEECNWLSGQPRVRQVSKL